MKYPILLIHGMGFRDDWKVSYWGRIKPALENQGYDVLLSGQDSNGSVESNANQISSRFDSFLKKYNADKVNIIAHSKGGLEARYLASSLGFADRIASITTLSTPHNGSETVDALMKFPKPLIKAGCKITDLWFRILGDKSPDTYGAIKIFLTDEAAVFNEHNPDVESVYYQSYAFVMKNARSDMFMWFPNLVVNHLEGENDGLLPPQAVKCPNFRGVVRGVSNRGISHCDEIDIRRKIIRITYDGKEADIVDLYLDIAQKLERDGY